MKALPLLKHNIDTILKARHLTRRDLAQWVRQSMNNKIIDPWISHIFGKPDAEFQMKYLDRIAEFFGLPVYQLFQPGISALTERRKSNRRTGRDRRISAMNLRVQESLSQQVAGISADDIALLATIKTLSASSRETIRGRARELADSERQTGGKARGRRPAETASGASKVPTTRAAGQPQGKSSDA